MDFARQVKAQVDILRTVGEYVKLRRMGARYVGLCPFHTEKTPSFNVNPAIGIYKCFGCGVAGDVIKFVQEVEGLTFWEALRSLAERNGIPVPQRREQSDAETDLRAAIYEMYDAAAAAYAQNLFGAPGTEARDYLSGRGLSASVAQQFLLGYSEPGWDGLVRRFGNRYSPQQMEASGLFGRREDGGFYDKFRGRLMFPVHNESGKVIGFGGRALRPEDEPKYLNSPETPIYKKSSVLYNLHRARESMRKNDRSVLVEGYMDVIGVYAAGVRNVVASCGTALTSAQVRCMKRHSENIVVNFDPDAAGANATERSLGMLLDEGMHVRVLELEGGLDPDDFIKKYGAAAYNARLEGSTNYFIWLADRARRKFGAGTAAAKMAGYEALLLPAIRRISDRLERAAVATEVADYLGLDRNIVLSEFRNFSRGRSPMPAQPQATHESISVRERLLLRSLVQSQEAREVLLPRLPEFSSVRKFTVWPILETIHAICEQNPEFTWEFLEARVTGDAKHLLSIAVFADHSAEVFTREQAEQFIVMLEAEESLVRYREVERQMQSAERAGNMEEAMRLMRIAVDMKRRIRVTPA